MLPQGHCIKRIGNAITQKIERKMKWKNIIQYFLFLVKFLQYVLCLRFDKNPVIEYRKKFKYHKPVSFTEFCSIVN